MPDPLRVTITLPLADAHRELISAVSNRVVVSYLSSAERYVYRDGRALWAGYAEQQPPSEDEQEDARRTLAPILAGTDVLLTNPIVPADILGRAPALRWVQLTSAGIDRLAESEMVQSDRIQTTTASGIHAVPISEYVIGAMIAFAKGFPTAMRQQTESHWQGYVAKELEDATVAVLGLGAIGRRVAELSKAFGMRVLAMRRSCETRMTGEQVGEPFVDEMLPPSDLTYALEQSDYIVLAVPLTSESQHMIGAEQFGAMKPSAVIVNIARGGVIDQDALIAALKSNRIAGAALDVASPEPLPPDSELWSAPNVMITPHISGGTPRYMERAIELFCDNLRRYLAGEPLRNVVDRERGY
jgi:phosphoglycerate dehydrogenase-like enzyme